MARSRIVRVDWSERVAQSSPASARTLLARSVAVDHERKPIGDRSPIVCRTDDGRFYVGRNSTFSPSTSSASPSRRAQCG